MHWTRYYSGTWKMSDEKKTHRYGVGELIHDEHSREAIVKEHAGTNRNGKPEYCIQYREPSFGFKHVTEDRISRRPGEAVSTYMLPETNVKCECGVQVVGQGKHSTWCPMFVKE